MKSYSVNLGAATALFSDEANDLPHHGICPVVAVTVTVQLATCAHHRISTGHICFICAEMMISLI